MEYRYQSEAISGEEFADLLNRSGLAARRPASDISRLQRMLDNADLVITARTADGKSVGVARSLTDWSYTTYLSDLAVDAAHQGMGIGTRLIEETRKCAGPETMLLLVAAPDAAEYYEKIGMPRCDRAFLYPRQK